jgi:cytochrome c-type biogenesis protein CcmE
MSDPSMATPSAASISTTTRATLGVPPRAPDAPTRRAPPSTAGAGRRRWRSVVVGAVLLGAFVLLVAKGLGSSLDYFETVDQAVQHQAALGTRTFRLEGVVVPGSIRRTSDGVAFVAAGRTRRVTVVNHGSPPQLFQPDIPVVVQGHFSGSIFVSDQVIVDHTAQYIEQHPARVRAPNGTVR